LEIISDCGFVCIVCTGDFAVSKWSVGCARTKMFIDTRFNKLESTIQLKDNVKLINNFWDRSIESTKSDLIFVFTTSS
jgi:hypothetical protein